MVTQSTKDIIAASTVRVHDDEDTLWAEVVEYPGCFATADSLEELMTETLPDALSIYLSDGSI